MTLSQLSKGLALALAMTAPLPCIAQPAWSARQPLPYGEWVNPHNTVKVATGDCGGKLCGWVIWATPEAEQDARGGGVQQLVSSKLLQDYRQIDSSHWQGRVFVPDMGRTFASTITLEEPDTLKISGCILGGLICKSQLWHKA